MDKGEDSQLSRAFEKIKRFTDLQEVYHKHLKLDNPPRLQYIVENAYKNKVCFQEPASVDGA